MVKTRRDVDFFLPRPFPPRLRAIGGVLAFGLALGVSAQMAVAGQNPQVLRIVTAGSHDLAMSAAVDASGNFIVAGRLDEPGTPSSFGLAKFSPEGQLLWRAYASPQTSAQAAPQPTAQAGANQATVRHIAVDRNGNIFATGTGPDDTALTAKFSPDGRQLWVRSYANGEGQRVGVDRSGNVFVGGSTQTPNHGADWLLLKYDSDGTQLWERTSDGPAQGDDRIVDMQLDFDGSLAVAGYREYLTPGGGTQTAIAKYDSSGNRRWLRTYLAAGLRDSLPMDLMVSARGEVHVTGLTSANLQNAELAVVPFGLRLGANGLLQLELNGAAAGGASVDVDADGNILLAGSISQNSRDRATAGPLASYVSKYDRYGTSLWSVQIGTRGSVDVVRARALANGNIFAAGTFVNAQGNGYLTRKLTAEGATLWEHRRHPTDRAVASDLVVDAVRALVLGQTSGNLQADVMALLFGERAPDVEGGGLQISTTQ